MARRITANAPLAVQATKESVLRCLALPLDDAYKLEQEISSMVFQSEDAKEAARTSTDFAGFQWARWSPYKRSLFCLCVPSFTFASFFPAF